MNIDLNWWKKRLLTPEIIFFIFVLCLSIYLYFKYDRHTIKLREDEIDYSVLFMPIRGINKKKEKRKKEDIWKSEKNCRIIFEKIFSQKFPSVRPAFLKNPSTGYNLELDGYCESLKLAFEYDGEQHSKYNKHFHKNPKEFIYQVAKDDFKTKMCKSKNIDLIRIPHYIHSSSLEDYIIREVKKIERLKNFC